MPLNAMNGNDAWVLIDYPLEFPMSENEKRPVVRRALQESTGRQSGVMMEVEFYPIPAVEMQDQPVLQTLLDNTYLPYVHPPFNVLPETPTNNNINFVTGAGAFLQQFIFGYPGLRFSADSGFSQKVAPLLPEHIKRLVIRNVSVRGRHVDITVPGAK